MEVCESKNLFKYDGPVGRRQYIINMFILFFMAIIVFAAIFLIMNKIGVNDVTRILMPILMLLGYIVFTCFVAINVAKRLYDIIGQKGRAMLYVVIFYLLSFGLSFSKILVILWAILSIVVNIGLLVVKGKMLTFEAAKAVKEEKDA